MYFFSIASVALLLLFGTMTSTAEAGVRAARELAGLSAVPSESEKVYLAAGATDKAEESTIGDPGQQATIGDPDEQAAVGDPGEQTTVGDPGQQMTVGDPGEAATIGDPGEKSGF